MPKRTYDERYMTNTDDKRNEPFRFADWEVYQDAQNAFVIVVNVVRKLPPDLRHTLGNQVIRSALSVVLNIAEGSGRFTDKELGRFFDISTGSVSETIAAVHSLLILHCISQEQFDDLLARYTSISRQLGGFKKKLRS
jgi:four helix bundle protein